MPISIESYLQRAIAKCHLIMTVPFVIEFLSMMDEGALLIDSIQATISLLNAIFKYLITYYNSFQTYLSIKISLKSWKCMSIRSNEFTRDKLLLLLNISWLFQLKKVDHNQLKPRAIICNEETKRGLVTYSIQLFPNLTYLF